MPISEETGFRKIGGGEGGFSKVPNPEKKTGNLPGLDLKNLGNFFQPSASSRWSFWSSEGDFFFGGEKLDLKN